MSRAPKPRLSSGRRVQVVTSTSSAPGLGAHAPVIKTGEKQEALPKRAIRTVLGFTVATLTLLFLVYVALAASVLLVMRAGDHNVAVLRGAYPVGQVPSGEFVYASSAPVDYSLMGKISEAVLGVPAGSVIQVVTGPANTIRTNKNGFIVADGERTPFKGRVPSIALEREYIAICIAGACSEGAAVRVSQDNIIGGVKGYISLSGIQQPDTAVQE